MQSQLDRIEIKLDLLIDSIDAIPEWIQLTTTVAEHLGYTRSGLRRKMLSVLEPEVEYRQIGKHWHIHRNSLWKLRREKRVQDD